MAVPAAVVVVLLVGGCWRAVSWAEPSNTPMVLSPAEAQQLEAKLNLLGQPRPNVPLSFRPIVITDSEANSYLRYKGQNFLPPAVQNPEVRINSDGIYGVADIDFGLVEKQSTTGQDWTVRALSMILTGRQRVSAVGKLDTGNGQAKVNIENVSIGNTPVPQVLVDWLLANYVQKKYNIDLSKPLVLPDHVARIELARGQATLVRSLNKK